MLSRQFKFSSALLIGTLAISLQGCVFEIGFAAVDQFLDQVHHGGAGHENHQHERQTPAHNHDKQGHKGDFCCDNAFTLLAKARFPQAQIVQPNVFSPPLKADEQPEPLHLTVNQSNFALLLSSISGSRDKYALSCLLHAPPLA